MKQLKKSINEIKDLLNDEVVSVSVLNELAADERKGVQKLLIQYENKQAKKLAVKNHFQEMLRYEKQAWSNNYQLIAGIDEVGRGPLAGPVVAAAVILPKDVEILGLNDSKQLSAVKREALFDEINKKAIAIGIAQVSPEEIDRINIYQASIEAMTLAIKQMDQKPDYLLIDAMKLPAVSLPQEAIIKGDAKSVSIAAASIIAKVTRDRMMAEYDQELPGYGFARNMGYGTAEHLAGLEKLGVTKIHRRTFAPIKDLV